MRRRSAELRDWIRQPAGWLILFAGVALSFFAWRSLGVEIEHAARASFEEAVAGTRNAMEQRLRGYRTVLHGLQGLFHASNRVEREEFSRYVRALEPAQSTGQLRAVSFARRVPHAQRNSYEALLRREFPRFAIKPAGERAEYLVLEFLEPFSEPGFGFDIEADALRRAAVEVTRDTGALAGSAPYILVSTPESKDAATSLRLAVYRRGAALDSLQARREAFAGVVNLTFRVRDLLEDLVPRHAEILLQMRISDAGELIYDSFVGELPSDAFRAAASLEVGGRMWQLEFAAPQNRFRNPSDILARWLTLLGGLTITVLLAGLVGALTTSTKRAHRIARDITADLRRSEAELAEAQRKTQALIETLPNPVFFKGTDGRYLGVNKAWETFFNVPRSGIIGKTVHDLYPHAPEVARRLHAKDEDLWQNPGTQTYETAITLPDGRQLDAVYYKATFAGPDGGVAGLIGTIIDVTAARQAARRQAMEHAVTQTLSNAEGMSDAAPQIIRTICETLGWACGAYWTWDEAAQVLRCAQTWHIDDAHVAQFSSATKVSINEAPAWQGDAPRTLTGGLVRRVWLDGAPVWFPDVTRETGFRRGPEAARAGLHCAFGFPVMAGGQPFGVMEFFARDIKQPDEALLSIARSIGSQIGQFIVRKQAEEKVRFVASHDALTALPNRVMFAQRLDHALAQAQRHGRRLAVLFIDLDRFKVINDTLGHDFGDRLLREVARRLSAALRQSDTVARLGGDEFVVLLEDISDPMYVAAVAQKLIAALAEGYLLADREYHVTASVGASTYPDDAADAQALLKNADIAMYRAKEQGRNTFQFYSSHLNLHSVQRLNLESGLRRALERDELVLHYQPQVDLRSGRITGVEALVRWRHPELGLLPPGRFIAIAEETGVIVPIGEWVVKSACTAQRAWIDSGLAPLRIAVNLSARQFLRGDLPRDIRNVLGATGCDPACLELEITESMVMEDPERVVALLQQIREIGVRVAIDDFGTGHSSLAYLKRFPVDNLKIDRSFVSDIPADRGDAAITQAVIAMGHSLGMRVIAEGVETRAQHDFLLAQNCDEYQGYFFSKPLPEPELRALLQAPRVRSARASKTPS